MSDAAQDFDDAFEEFAAAPPGLEGAGAPDEAGNPEPPDDDAADAPKGGQAESGPGDDDGQGGSQGGDGARGDDGDGAQEAEDPVAAARREVEEWKHRYNSDLGRQAALQRKIQEQEQMLRQLQQQAQQQAQQKPQEPKREGDEAPDGSGMSDAEWTALQQDFPEFAKAIEFKLSRIEEQYGRKLSQLERMEQARQAQQQEAYITKQYQALEAEHPDYREIAGDPSFATWLQQQPRQIQEISNSWDARETAYLLRLYKQDAGGAQQQPADIQARRQRQLQQAQSVSGRAGRSGGNQPPADDYDAAFDFFASQG